jgi:hypothetical protein
VWSDIPGGGSSSLVPDPFVIAIHGREYLHDLEFKPWKRQAMRATTTTITRTQADTSNEPGEQSLSTEQLWRRTQDSWHEGASQVFLDRKSSSEFSFRSSKGIDPWTQWQLQLLHTTTRALSSANTNVQFAVCNNHLYLLDGTALKYTSDLVTFTTVTGTPGGVTPSSICSDGHSVYVAYGASGVYSTTEGAASATQYVSTGVSSSAIVRFTMGRLMVASGASLYNVITSGALPAALGVSNYGNLVWTDLTNGNGVIFAAGNSGDVGVIYSIQINADGTALAAPILCGQLPNGETVNAIYGYAGSGVAIGTSQGWRFAEQALANGVAGTVSLTIGPVTLQRGGVSCFSGFDRFIWGNYDNYDVTSTGLFRMDPSVFVSDLAPAWATDLMTDPAMLYQGHVTSVVHFQATGGSAPTPVYAVAGVGVIIEDTTNYVLSGTIDSGLITYGIADNKRPVFVDLTFQALPSSGSEGFGPAIQTLVSLDGGSFSNTGIAESAGQTFAENATNQDLCQTMEIREVLYSDWGVGNQAGSIGAQTPVLTRHTIRSVPAAVAPTDWNVVIQLREKYTIKDVEHFIVPSDEYAILDALRSSKQIVTLQVGNINPGAVTIESIDWIPEQWASLSGELNGVAVITCRTVV